MKKLLAADIGGSKTKIVLLDTQGKILCESTGAGVAAIFESTDPIPELEKQLEQIENKEDICVIAINLGGKNTEQVSMSFRKFFPTIPQKIFRESEGCAAYTLGQKYGAEIVLMAGTGAIAVGQQGGNFVITGGWGCNVGDDGSGYDIGLQAIRKTFLALDGECEMTPLTEYLSGQNKPLSATKDPIVYMEARDNIRKLFLPLDRKKSPHTQKQLRSLHNKATKRHLKYSSMQAKSLQILLCAPQENWRKKLLHPQLLREVLSIPENFGGRHLRTRSKPSFLTLK